MKIFLLPSLMLLFYVFNFANGIAADNIKVVVRDQQATLSYQVIDEGKLLVSVLDGKEEPIRGLAGKDFRVGSGIQKAEILSAAPLETT